MFLYHYTHDYPEKEGEITTVLPDLLTLCGFHAMTIELLAKLFNADKIEILNAYQAFSKKITTDWDDEIMERSIAKHMKKQRRHLSLSKKAIPLFGTSHVRLSEHYLYTGNLNSSIYYLKQQVQILKMLPNQEKEIAEYYKKIGRQYQELGSIALAYRYHKECLKMRKQFCLPLSFERSACYTHIVFYYQEIGQYWKALSNAKQARNIRLRLYGSEHSITAWSYNNLALLYFYLYEYGKALIFINHSIQIRERHSADQEEAMEICIRRLNKRHIITAPPPLQDTERTG